MSDWKFDPVAARHHAEQFPKDGRFPPHWLRCEWGRVVEGEFQRCIKPEGHEKAPGSGAEHSDGIKPASRSAG